VITEHTKLDTFHHKMRQQEASATTLSLVKLKLNAKWSRKISINRNGVCEVSTPTLKFHSSD